MEYGTIFIGTLGFAAFTLRTTRPLSVTAPRHPSHAVTRAGTGIARSMAATRA
jgi:hypothetical protein